jgi:Mn2+/Fe2+ NRAMP family transporter
VDGLARLAQLAPRQQLLHMPLHDASYLYLLAANLGSSVMPWTVFYQQSALIDKGWTCATCVPRGWIPCWGRCCAS